MSELLPEITIYTDGSCSPNPGEGGWAVAFIAPDNTSETLHGGEKQTTNNRMELTAALKALQHLTTSHDITLHTDSRYLKDGITEWLENWRKRDWTTITGEDVANRDLWQQLSEEIKRHKISWQWVKGHADNEWNILVDKLAGSVRQRPNLPLNDREAVHIFLSITWRQKFGAGAWAGVMQYRDTYKVVGGFRAEGSGNSLHIFSAIEALRNLKRPLAIHLYTTSGYLKDGATNWMPQWRRRDWLTREGLEVSNRQDWQDLADLLHYIPVKFHQIDKENPPCHILEAKEIAKDLFESEHEKEDA